MAIRPQDRNWQDFIQYHAADWHGCWTRYRATGAVQESFRSLRRFQTNADRTAITQTNRYLRADATQEQQWSYNQEDNSLADGLCHPQADVMRSLCFPSGHAAWVMQQCQPDSFFAVELFFRYQTLRHSVGIVYDRQGQLLRTSNIREDTTGFPGQFWSDSIEQLPQPPWSGQWSGRAIAMQPNLTLSAPQTTHLAVHWGQGQCFYLPDGISVCCPTQIRMGTPFTLAVNWCITSDTLEQVVVEYDRQGAFTQLILEQLSPRDPLLEESTGMPEPIAD